MTDYFDIRCGDDLDMFARDVRPLEVFAQDLYHLLVTNWGALVRDPTWGLGLESYLGRPLPATLAYDIETLVRKDDRANDARCTITEIPGEPKGEAFILKLEVECDAGFLEVALKLTPSGIVRVAT